MSLETLHRTSSKNSNKSAALSNTVTNTYLNIYTYINQNLALQTLTLDAFLGRLRVGQKSFDTLDCQPTVPTKWCPEEVYIVYDTGARSKRKFKYTQYTPQKNNSTIAENPRSITFKAVHNLLIRNSHSCKPFIVFMSFISYAPWKRRWLEIWFKLRLYRCKHGI